MKILAVMLALVFCACNSPKPAPAPLNPARDSMWVVVGGDDSTLLKMGDSVLVYIHLDTLIIKTR